MKKRTGWKCPRCHKFSEETLRDKVEENVVKSFAVIGVCFLVAIVIVSSNVDIFERFQMTALSAMAAARFDMSDSMKQVTYNITAPCLTDKECSANAIFNFVLNNQTYSTTAFFNNAKSSLNMGYSDCKNQAILVANMLAIKGIEYQFVALPNHMYALAKTEKGWLRVDTTMLVFGYIDSKE